MRIENVDSNGFWDDID